MRSLGGLCGMSLEKLGKKILCIFTVGALFGGSLWHVFGKAWEEDAMHIYERVSNFVCIFRLGG